MLYMLYFISLIQKTVFMRDLNSGPWTHEHMVRSAQRMWSPLILPSALHLLFHSFSSPPLYLPIYSFLSTDPSIQPSIHPPIHPSILPPTYLTIHPSMHPPINLPTCLSISVYIMHPYIQTSTLLSSAHSPIHPCTCVCIHPFTHLFTPHPSNHPSIHPSHAAIFWAPLSSRQPCIKDTTGFSAFMGQTFQCGEAGTWSH